MDQGTMALHLLHVTLLQGAMVGFLLSNCYKAIFGKGSCDIRGVRVGTGYGGRGLPKHFCNKDIDAYTPTKT